jgi:lipopolysaccharide transport system ATP-binding protein
MEKVIEVKNVDLSYRSKGSLINKRSHQVFKGLSFDLYRGETLGVIGGNGAGKSTLLKLLAGIYRPDAGSILNHSKRTSLLSLNAGFDVYLNGHDNALISGMLMGYSKASVQEVMPLIEAYSELKDFFYQPIRSYSSGMKARLGFAIAAYLKPEVLLVDEVLGVGDQDFKKKAKKTMRELIKSDQTVVLVSHSLRDLRDLSDRVLWVDGGRVKRIGAPLEVMSAY